MPIYKTNGKKDGLQKYNVRINYISDNGEHKQLTRVAYGADSAKTLEMRLYNEIKEKCEMPVKKITLKELFDEYISNKKYEVREVTLVKTKRVLELHILPQLGKKRADKLAVQILQEWKISIENKSLGIVSKNNIYKELRTMLNYAVKMEYISKNPLLKVGNFKDAYAYKKKISFYTSEEFIKFIEIARQQALQKEQEENNLYEWNYYVFFNIAFYTGLRKGEIHALRWSDIDGDYLSVERSLNQKLHNIDIETPPKNKSSIRPLQIPVPLIKILNDHKKRQKLFLHFNENNRILGTDRSLRNSTIHNRNELYSSLAEVKRIRMHDFRHSHASLLANMGINIQEIARRLGHAKIEMTWNTYSHLYPKEEEKAVAVLNNVF
jgi:integrase